MRCLLTNLAIFRTAVLVWLMCQLFLPWVPAVLGVVEATPASLRTAAVEHLNLTLSMAVDVKATPQGTEVTITGRVTDSNGTGVISEVSIEVRNPYGSTIRLRLTSTDSAGSFRDSLILPDGSPAGSYSIYLAACRGIICAKQSSSFTLSSPDFLINVTPNSATVEQGEAASFNVTVQPLGAFNSTVKVQLLNAPNATSYTFSQSLMLPHSSTQLTIITSPDTPVGTFNALIVASGGGKEHSETILLTVKPTSPLPNTWVVSIALGAILATILVFALWRRGKKTSTEFRLEEDKDSLAVVRALAKLEELKAVGKISPQEYERLRKEYDSRLEKLTKPGR